MGIQVKGGAGGGGIGFPSAWSNLVDGTAMEDIALYAAVERIGDQFRNIQEESYDGYGNIMDGVGMATMAASAGQRLTVTLLMPVNSIWRM